MVRADRPAITIEVMKKSMLALGAAALCLSLSACAPPADEAPVSSGAQEPGQSAAAPTQQAQSATPTPTTQAPPKLGQTYTWDDGLAVTIGGAQEYQPSAIVDEEYHLEAGTPLKFQITIQNNTPQPVDASQFISDLVSAGEPAEQVEDLDQGISLPSGTIEPGASLSYTAAFIVPDPGSFEITWYDLTQARDKVVFSQ